MLTTRFTKLVGCTVPIQQAGMGAAAPPELAAAMSEAGAFGMLGAARGGLNATTLAGMLDRTRKLTTRPFGVNFIMRPGGVAARSPRQFIEQAASAARAVEFFYTDPNAEFVRIVHDHGALASWQVGSRKEALAAAEAGAISSSRRASERADMYVARLGYSICSARCSNPCRKYRCSRPGESATGGRWRRRSRQGRTVYEWARGSSPPKRPECIRSTPRH